MINDEKLKKDLMGEVMKIAEGGLRMHTDRIKQGFAAALPEISTELWREVESIYWRYKKLVEIGRVGDLEWIHISFLRTGLIDCTPCYRIDFYDSVGCVSEIECMGMWGFPYIFDGYYEIEKQIIDRMKQQTRIKLYEADGTLNSLAEFFRAMADTYIPELINYRMRDFKNTICVQKKVKIMLGEFLDSSELIAEF